MKNPSFFSILSLFVLITTLDSIFNLSKLYFVFAQSTEFDSPGYFLGQEAYDKAVDLYSTQSYMKAASFFWKSILSRRNNDTFQVHEAFQNFVNCYKALDDEANAYAFVAAQYTGRGMNEEALVYARQALRIDPTNKIALDVMDTFQAAGEVPKSSVNKETVKQILREDGDDYNIIHGQKAYDVGLYLLNEEKYEEAYPHLWAAVVSKGPTDEYDVMKAYELFFKCWDSMGDKNGGHVFVAKQYISRGQIEMGVSTAKKVLTGDPSNIEALLIVETYTEKNDVSTDQFLNPFKTKTMKQIKEEIDESMTLEERIISLYNKGTGLFGDKKMGEAADYLQAACELSNYQVYSACINAAYCRTFTAEWGPKGKHYKRDMKVIEYLVKQDIEEHLKFDDETSETYWGFQMGAHPHMMLGFPIEDMKLKKRVSENYAYTDIYQFYMDERQKRKFISIEKRKEILGDFPIDQSIYIDKYREEYYEKGGKIKLGFLGAGFNSKAVLFLAQDIFRFYNKTKFEVHILSTGDPDNPQFIEKGMRGVDWRKRVQENVDYFHDFREVFEKGPKELALEIQQLGIHILFDWDGFARQGYRAQGLMGLRPAPVQVMHQEYLGTSGGNYDYIVTDKTTSPEYLEDNYSEKFIYMPHHFFCKGHRMQKEVVPPRLEYLPKTNPYTFGTGSPQENKCLRKDKNFDPSFVFCSFNKFLKLSPQMFSIWLEVLEEVPDSMLCMLMYPTEGVPNFLDYINREKPELLERISFLPWENNPFDHQQRSHDLCNAFLDTRKSYLNAIIIYFLSLLSYISLNLKFGLLNNEKDPYNGHTTGMDSLYGGAPVVTRSDGEDMGSRVITSANIVLGIPELNAMGYDKYKEVAVRLGTNKEFYSDIRTKLVKSALQDEPMHPFWDMERYTRNFEKGLIQAFEMYLNGKEPSHIFVQDDDEEEKEKSSSSESSTGDEL